MTEICIESTHPPFRRLGEPDVAARVVIEFPPGYAKQALAALAQAVLDVLVEARKTDGPAA